ncbi:hemerythrin domain-containing protein [Hugenholtzia roseola]|uniref:hemerythrin domain-containing protein n=1 Tax=Hugenholtzia roseola TaxID=1002 RepID=UPI00041DB230|nr:hemerythrin domain-containing protein [Hugenholtzia roseola]
MKAQFLAYQDSRKRVFFEKCVSLGLRKNTFEFSNLSLTMNFPTTRIETLVEQDYMVGAALHRFGIDFYRYEDKTFSEVCREKGIDAPLLWQQIEKTAQKIRHQAPPKNLSNFPIQVILDYLYHTHRIFIRQQIPYMAALVEAMKPLQLPRHFRTIVEDLKVAFPLFAQDFIHHIFEEEAHLFEYITLLDKALLGQVCILKTYFPMEKFSLAQAAHQHSQDDDEMEGIRLLTNQYELLPYTPLIIRVLYAELQHFEKLLSLHAAIEDDILFPKALVLEQKVKDNWQQIVKWS